ncbi:polysaccharide biosynthesis/export family protein [Wenxinia marina]|uniref:Periplasmic protein involved in polysaccharide export n=1 Tax=Wenxinia marina DSM 24838 TaxID=1123501 RepID=A0A0D0QAD8_9RHOB|nr:polysaccharide biosynthesis/export family protein [Wenxinia marina]KIQ71439.1 Periplasmic protein involved in polysaccharide export [Wenxinia marina DSM 24838]GGL79021.1 polysaccharide biosynthesis protein [Wenxinia marina]
MRDWTTSRGRTAAARALILGLTLGLAACAPPRGAAIQSEILETRTGQDAALRDFAVAPVTRTLLPVYAAWPRIGGESYPWIERVDQPNNRIIAAGDTVSVRIWSTEENGLLTTTGQRAVDLGQIRVGASGSIFLPYVGSVRVSGMSPETARDRIEELYTAVTPSAQVQFDFVEGRQNTVSLVGGVATPGSYPLPDRDFSIMGLIAEGGGVAATIDNPQVRLHRGDRIFGISMERLLDSPRLDTTLVGGDQVYIEEDDRFFISLGAAGAETLHPFRRERITALEAMAMIGGVNETRADPQGILILRRYPASAVRADASGPDHMRVVFTLDMTSADGLFSAGEFQIMPGDLVYVTESPITSTVTVLGLIGTVFGLATQVSG